MAVRRTLALLLAAPAVLMPALLAGCGDDSSVADPPVASASPTVVTSGPARESLRDFISRWVQEDTDMQNTGDASAFLSMSRDCKGCKAVARTVSRIYADGGKVSTRGWTIVSMKSVPSGDTRRLVDLRVDSAPTTYRESEGAPVKHLAGGQERFQLQLIPHANSWLVHSFVQVSS